MHFFFLVQMNFFFFSLFCCQMLLSVSNTLSGLKPLPFINLRYIASEQNLGNLAAFQHHEVNLY